MKHSRGFTLLESLLTAGTAALLVALALPAMVRVTESSDAAVCRARRKALQAMTAAAAVSDGIDWSNYRGTERTWTSAEIFSYLKAHGAGSIQCPCGATISAFRVVGSSVVFRCSRHGGEEDVPVSNSAVLLGHIPAGLLRPRFGKSYRPFHLLISFACSSSAFFT